MRRLPILVLLLAAALIVVSWPAVSELFKPGYFANHDGEGHLIRLQEFDIALRDGQFPPRLSKNLMYGYGYYFFNFNYPLVYWAGEAVHVLGVGFVGSVKAISVLGLVLSGLAMFFWQRPHWGNWGAFVAAMLYMYAPYRFLNIYVRGSLAEHLAFIMLPLLFMSTERIIEGEPKKRARYVIFGGISYALLLLSHNITAFIFTIVLGLFMLFHLVLYKKIKFIADFALVGLSGLALSAFFWVPALLEKKFVRLDQTIGQDYPDHFVFIQQLWQRSWGFGGSGPGLSDGMSFQIGVFHLAFFLLSIPASILLWRKYRARAWHILFYIVVFILSIFLMLSLSKPLWDNLPLLPFTQFPWRFLSWSVFATSVLGGAVTFTIIQNLPKWKFLLAPLLVITAMIFLVQSNKDYWSPNQRVDISLPGDRPISGSTTWADEQFPVWFDPKPTGVPESRVELLEGSGEIQIQEWKTGSHKYTVSADTPVTLIEKTAYYPGWTLSVNGAQKDFSFEDEENPGRIVYSLKPGSFEIKTTFSETPLRQSMNILSLASLALVLLGVILTTKPAYEMVKKLNPF